MLWSPNSQFANNNDIKQVHGGWTPYWPGKNFVDLGEICSKLPNNPRSETISVGLSFYAYGGYERQNILPPKNMALNMIKNFDRVRLTPFLTAVMLTIPCRTLARRRENTSCSLRPLAHTQAACRVNQLLAVSLKWPSK